MNADRQRAKVDFINDLNHSHELAHPNEPELAARIASYELAFRMQAHAPEVIDLSKETEETKTLYGLVSQRRIPFRKAGRRLLFLESELLEWTRPVPNRRARCGDLTRRQ